MEPEVWAETQKDSKHVEVEVQIQTLAKAQLREFELAGELKIRASPRRGVGGTAQ